MACLSQTRAHTPHPRQRSSLTLAFLRLWWRGSPAETIPIDYTGHMSVLVDIPAQKRDQAEREELRQQLEHSQKLESIGRLAGGVAHDFNNLLTVINGYSDMLIKGLLEGDPQRQAIEEIRDAGERAAALTKQLLTFGRRQIGQPRPLELNALISGAE